MTSVTILDYGLGNLFNLELALSSLGATVSFASLGSDIPRCERLVLPGVGAFEAGMSNLRSRGLIEPILAHARSGKPLLGICLGMQLLMSESEENGRWSGLDIFQGKVRRLNPQDSSLKVPQIGWNSIELAPQHTNLLDFLPAAPEVYFVHSFCVEPADVSLISAHTSYGNDSFCSVICSGNIVGCQFHPERSATHGLTILGNFLR